MENLILAFFSVAAADLRKFSFTQFSVGQYRCSRLSRADPRVQVNSVRHCTNSVLKLSLEQDPGESENFVSFVSDRREL